MAEWICTICWFINILKSMWATYVYPSFLSWILPVLVIRINPSFIHINHMIDNFYIAQNRASDHQNMDHFSCLLRSSRISQVIVFLTTFSFLHLGSILQDNVLDEDTRDNIWGEAAGNCKVGLAYCPQSSSPDILCMCVFKRKQLYS